LGEFVNQFEGSDDPFYRSASPFNHAFELGKSTSTVQLSPQGWNQKIFSNAPATWSTLLARLLTIQPILNPVIYEADDTDKARQETRWATTLAGRTD
jgi:hypothetical protein